MERSWRDLFIDIVVDRVFFKNNEMTLVPRFTIAPKTISGLLKKQGLKRPNTSMSVPPLALYKWTIKHKRNRKPQKHKRDQICIVPF